ncbi:hypothetical protein GCM10011348_07610 [Marinobacterium nitratireducens]|uniref:Recombinase domain-containing protein n=2 Tax=Marinobacterium nitratireducens TaxID=518897 RepID=A0A917Z805_9GAMM|nr:hypothetical protein GCM10011348_07610 [Marinobacterium nitratireducens]
MHQWLMNEEDLVIEVMSSRDNLLKKNSKLRQVFELAKRTGRPVVVTRIDRLTRNLDAAQAFFDAGIPIFESQNNDFISERQAISYLNRCEEEREKKIKTTKKTFDEKRARGETFGNPNIREVQVNAAAQARNKADEFARQLYPELKTLRSEGLSYSAIAKRFNDEGRATRQGGKWSANTVKDYMDRIENPEKVRAKSKRKSASAVQSTDVEKRDNHWDAYGDNPDVGSFA